jgi:transcription antitermination factor NusG
VLQTPGVVQFVYWLGKPAVIRDAEMAEIQAFFAQHGAETIVSEAYQAGQELLIEQGPFKDRKGVLLRQNKQYVVLRVPELGMVFSVRKQDVAAIEA